jgi:hypothetical protein
VKHFSLERGFISNVNTTNSSLCLKTIQDAAALCGCHWSLLVLAGGGGAFHSPAKLPSGKRRLGGWESTRGDHDTEEKMKFLVPAGYRIWILQPVACTEVVETIPVDNEKDGAVCPPFGLLLH